MAVRPAVRALCALLLVLPPALPARAGTTAGGLLSADALAARRTAAGLRAAAGTGLGPLLTALQDLRGTAASVPALPAPSAADLAATAGLPAAARAPVAGLLAAARTAADEIGPIPAGGAAALGARWLGALEGWQAAGGAVRRPVAPAPQKSEPRFVAPPELPGAPWLARATAAMPRAAALLAAAIDLHLPALRRAATTTSSTPAPAAGTANGCDMVDEAPLLCVGSAAATTFTADAVLTVDLGGADTYRTGAGSAPFLADGTWHPVAVAIDTGGADRYEPVGANGIFPGLASAQGASVFGAVGILVDTSGDDTYAAAPPASGGVALAQGASIGGLGLLVDLGGADTRTVTAPNGTSDGYALIAQGSSGGCAGTTEVPPMIGCPVAALVDSGGGNDTYTLDGGHVTGPGGARSIFGQGYAVFGAALLADDGGTDAITATASGDRLGPRDFLTAQEPRLTIEGQGFATAGAAVLLGGPGPTTYRIEERAQGMVWNIAHGQGAGVVQGTGILDDAGGNDRYVLSASSAYDLGIVIDDTCTTLDEETGEEIRCPSAVATFTGQRGTVSNSVSGQGYSAFQSDALLADAGGDDVYQAESLIDVDVALEDRLSQPSASPSLSVESYHSASLAAQGAGEGFTGTGVLLDAAGRDAYRFTSINDTSASVTSEHAPGAPAVTAMGDARTFIVGQGAGDFGGFSAAFLDLGGTGDTIEATMENPVTTDPAGGELRWGMYWPYVQGAFGGVFAALGADPTIISRPSRPVCITSTGRRGFGQWMDCVPNVDQEHETYDAIPIWTHHTQGLAPLATGRDPQVAFTAASARTGAVGKHVTVSAKLTDPDGKPMAGAPLRFDLQYGCWLGCQQLPDQIPKSFGSQWEAVATTGPDGVAEARLPLVLMSWQNDYLLPPWSWRMLATFDGAKGIYPRRTSVPFTITPA